ncbi:MAG: ATP synthase F1 subunit gamma [Candidatus Liptonbacteria bacterium]|nr:ATP synthase F1 subunit gamma [Candidatus Liptonbacteria bacterium]
MPGLQHIKRRITAVKSTKQVTQAMELVAATKMRRAQETALSSRPYALTALEILANLVEDVTLNDPEGLTAKRFPLLATHPVRQTAVLLVAADKGLAGSFNSSIFRKFEQFFSSYSLLTTPHSLSIIAIGQKATDYARRRGFTVEASFVKFGDLIHLTEVEPLAQLLSDGFTQAKWDRVVAFSASFVSALRQEVVERQLLPLSFDRIRQAVEQIIPQTGRYAELRQQIVASRLERPVEHLIEPSPEEALNHLLPLLFQMEVYHLILEANASEHSARRMAMKSATDSAGELIGNLTLAFNRARQASITGELTEIAGTVSAMEK